MLEERELLTEGKGKRVYATDDPRTAIVYFKDEAMAFHGLKRGRIMGKGEVNNEVCRHIFLLLKRRGIENHFIRRLDDRRSLVRRLEIIPFAVKVRNRVAGSLVGRLPLTVGSFLYPPVVEFVLKDEELDNTLINSSHIRALRLATLQEIDFITATALKINEILTEHLAAVDIELIDFKLEFGRDGDKIILADEISPDTARFWDSKTHEPLDIDRFRQNLGNVEQAYQDVLQRMMGLDAAENLPDDDQEEEL